MKQFSDIYEAWSHSEDWEQGYQDALNKIKAAIEQREANGQSTDPDDMQDDISNISKEVDSPRGRKKQDSQSQQSGQSDQSGSGQQEQDDMGELEKELQDAVGGNRSRTSKGDENQGEVRPEDCVGPDSLKGTPGTPGGMVDRKTGDQIAKGEGYPEDGGSDSVLEKEWRDQAIKAASKMRGDKDGFIKHKLEGLYKTSTDWKKELRKIVGNSISPDEKRQAYANKNVLVTQDRIARTDKDKYDNVDYICAFIDSSGSMSDEQLRMCLSEVYQVALQKKPMRIVVIQCDTKIQEIKEYTNVRQLQKDFKTATVKGRGGTELKPCWDLLKNDPKFRRSTAELVMVFTDGYLNQYKRDPRSMNNLCWVIIDNTEFNLQYKDIRTKVVFINSKDVK